jgi:ANTAR domain
MKRFNIDAVQAFQMPTRLSQETNTRIRDLAERVIDSRGQSSERSGAVSGEDAQGRSGSGRLNWVLGKTQTGQWDWA